MNPNGKVLHSGINPAGVRKQSGDAGSSGLSASAANPFSKVSISSTNVGGRSRDTIRRGIKCLSLENRYRSALVFETSIRSCQI